MSLASLAIKGAVWNLIDKLINQLGMFIVTIYLATILSPQDFGLIGMVMIFVLISDSLVNSGFSQALIQRSNKVTESELSTVLVTNVVLSFLIYILLYFSIPSIVSFYQEPKLEYISKTLFLVVIINSFSVVTRAKLTINVDFKSQAQSNTVATISGSVAAIVLANMGFGYWSIVGLALVKAFVSTIFLSYFCDWKPKLFFCYYSFKRLFKFGSNLMIAGLLSTLANNLHAILIGRYFNATYVGYYSQGVNLTNTLSGIISSVFYGVSYPILTSINEDREKLVQAYEKVVKMTMLVSMPCMLGFAAVADTFTELFLGEQWLPVIPILVILSIARMLTPISLVNMNILNAIGRSDLFLKVDLIKIPIFVFAILIAVPYGIHGIAIANLLTTILSFFINAYFPGKIFNFGAREQIKVSMRIIISSTIMYFVVSFVSIQDLWIELVFKVFTGAFLYIFGLFILRENSIKILYRQISLGLKN